MKRLISLASIGAGFYYFWIGADVLGNFVAMALVGFGILIELTVPME